MEDAEAKSSLFNGLNRSQVQYLDINEASGFCLLLEQFQALFENSLAVPVERIDWDSVFNFVDNVPNVDESGVYFYLNQFLLRSVHVFFPPNVLFANHTPLEIVEGFYSQEKKKDDDEDYFLFHRLPWIKTLRKIYDKANGNNNIALLRKLTSSSIFEKSSVAFQVLQERQRLNCFGDG